MIRKKNKQIVQVAIKTVIIGSLLGVLGLVLHIAFFGLKATLDRVFEPTSGSQISEESSIKPVREKHQFGFVYGETDQFHYWKVDPQQYELDLYWKDSKDSPYLRFGQLQQELIKRPLKLIFAMNAGIFETDKTPLGLHIEHGRTLRELNVQTGQGNFYFAPNGVFFVTMSGEADILSTENYLFFMKNKEADLRLASQSGPLLVRGNTIHPGFNATSESKKIRNGVGVDKEGLVYFVLAKEAVNFYTFASFFKHTLHCPDALFLDGEISQAWYPEAGIEGQGNFVGMFGVTERF